MRANIETARCRAQRAAQGVGPRSRGRTESTAMASAKTAESGIVPAPSASPGDCPASRRWRPLEELAEEPINREVGCSAT